jgi:hypothetical protein
VLLFAQRVTLDISPLKNVKVALLLVLIVLDQLIANAIRAPLITFSTGHFVPSIVVLKANFLTRQRVAASIVPTNAQHAIMELTALRVERVFTLMGTPAIEHVQMDSILNRAEEHACNVQTFVVSVLTEAQSTVLHALLGSSCIQMSFANLLSYLVLMVTIKT